MSDAGVTRAEMDGRLRAVEGRPLPGDASPDYELGYLDMRSIIDDLKSLTTVDRKHIATVRRTVREAIRDAFAP